MPLQFGPSSLNSPSGKSTPSNSSIKSVRVKDIVLTPNHPRFDEVGGWAGLGTIFFDDTSSPGLESSFATPTFARPYFSNSKFFPLINELVVVIPSPDPITNQSNNTLGNSILYYFPPANTWNSQHHNALPDQTIKNPISSNKTYDEINNGSVVREKSQEVPYILGATFGQTNDPNKGGWVPSVENINTDLSSIYLTSTQNIPLFPSSYKTDSFGPQDNSPSSPSKYKGNQIILNSGRLVLNAKQDSILLSSPNIIHLSAGSSIHLDTSDKIVLSSSEIYLVGRNADERAVLGDKLVLELNKLIPVLEGLAKACTTAAAGPFPVATLVLIGPSLEASIKDFKKSLAGDNPKVLSTKVKLQ